ncbi:MAG TPA: hypothetical protein VFN56_03920 [Candidatus Saccharimonadales bacterium]|nr:hypothetical protein [Candidatus Saccharimonadales bacterium]
MSKAEPVEHEGYAVPNWLQKCKSTVTSAPAIGTVAVVLIVVVSFVYWQHRRPAYSDISQSQPSGPALQVTASSPTLPVSSPTQSMAPQTSTSLPDSTPVGPAPTTSADSLQPNSGALTLPSTGTNQGLTGAVTHTTQAAGTASSAVMNSLGL